MTNKPMIIFNEAELRDACRYWQKQLGLSDWEVITMISRKKEFDNEDSLAEVHRNIDRKEAVVMVLDEREVDEWAKEHWGIDNEESVVHELLHLHFAGFDKPDKYNRAEEQVIVALSKALVRLRRAAGGEFCEDADLGDLGKIGGTD